MVTISEEEGVEGVVQRLGRSRQALLLQRQAEVGVQQRQVRCLLVRTSDLGSGRGDSTARRKAEREKLISLVVIFTVQPPELERAIQ